MCDFYHLDKGWYNDSSLFFFCETLYQQTESMFSYKIEDTTSDEYKHYNYLPCVVKKTPANGS